MGMRPSLWKFGSLITKKAPEIRGFFAVGWWRRRELNPRPMLSMHMILKRNIDGEFELGQALSIRGADSCVRESLRVQQGIEIAETVKALKPDIRTASG